MLHSTGIPVFAHEETAAVRPASLDSIAGPRSGPAQARRSATLEKLEWLDAVLADRRVNATTFTVAYVIAQHWNSKAREAWPSQRRMMLLAGVSETTLRACLKTLIDFGYLAQLKRGVRNGNKYLLRTPDVGPAAVQSIPSKF